MVWIICIFADLLDGMTGELGGFAADNYVSYAAEGDDDSSMPTETELVSF